MKIRPSLVALAAAALAVAFVLSGCSANSGTSSPAPTQTQAIVTSSIVDGAQLTAPVQWTATVKTFGGQSVSSVAFTVDGKTEWTDKTAPYFFNDNNNYLYPWLLGAGTHTLGLTVKLKSGSTVETKFGVSATAPVVPTGLVGTWSRAVSASDFSSPDNTPTGVWMITVGANGLITMAGPAGNHQDEAFTATPAGAMSLAGTVNWLVPANQQAGFCDPELPEVYSWQRSGSTLTLASTTDSGVCKDRYAVFHGAWTAVAG
jgi:hypothetical protein